ncbi:FAD dependent oxidoreductase [Punctularia strigosozonata HHB-11173 SS5]|uniref:FAD dependent oxidoreductase n=1 Tax=Punctularia strigosozonata (strain HHB-11173) TaxID=741275 RepID=UPI00044183B5|nr:FAD dependent oxidoreductase [Punctularia strigosozonata HHB-11173 SS5]EIN14562.1 FAD dependent oxidoreductase [Punctularia strigosozonata HHB-11173 SS5]
MSSTSEEIVIIGAGIIGSTIAYYITRHPRFSSNTRIIILEASKVGAAQGASGKAGGLVARWAYPKELVNVSFPEHVRLAEEHGGEHRWGWRFVKVGNWEGHGERINRTEPDASGRLGKWTSLEKEHGLDGGRRGHHQGAALPKDLNWVKPELTESYSSMAPDGHTAQVHPYLFTTSMLELAKEKGADLILGQAKSIERENGKVVGVTYIDYTSGEMKMLPATKIILSAGAWSPSLVPTIPVSGTRAHSITIKAGEHIAPYCLFTEIQLPTSSGGSKLVTPEIYARPDEVYACGSGDKSTLPPSVDEVEVDEAACDSIETHVASISDQLRFGTVQARQACFLPVVSTGGGPIIGEAKKVAQGLFIATGHTCWGICNAPGTAKALSELVMDGKISCAKLGTLDPSRYLL